jgi:pimeloyl-ACP methyl ester carboxylesterase
MRAFAAKATCLVPDYGLRDSLSAMADHVLASVPQRTFSLVGHSMGGRVALEVFRKAPERVERIALLDTGYQAIADAEAGQREREGRERLLRIAQEKGMREMGESWARGMVHADVLDTPIFTEVLEMIERSSPEKFAAQINALLNRPDATALLSQIDVPALILCGRDDQWSPLSRHEAMRDEIAGAQLRVIEDSGHMTTMEQPEAVTAALEEWLAWKKA